MLKTIALALCASWLCGCATVSRLPAPPVSQSLPNLAGFPPEVRISSQSAQWSEATNTLFERAIGASDGSFDVLALSGGGAGGAFGVGVLVGLQQSGQRPQFEIVTGVSSGALIAPYALLGPKWDKEVTEIYTAPETSKTVVRRGIDAIFRPSLYRTDGFVKAIKRRVTPEFLGAIAAESRKGRLLFVATTNVDTGTSTIWNMGLIAEQGGLKARQLFVDVLVASASVPAVFPPKLINVESGGQNYQEMHVDGGVAVSFFLVPESMTSSQELKRLSENANMYVIINGQIEMGIANRVDRTTSIVARSFEIDQIFKTRQSIALTAEIAARNDFKFRFTRIPADFPYQGSLNMERAPMQALFDKGVSLARTGRLWLGTDDLVLELRRDDKPAPLAAPSPLVN